MEYGSGSAKHGEGEEDIALVCEWNTTESMV